MDKLDRQGRELYWMVTLNEADRTMETWKNVDIKQPE